MSYVLNFQDRKECGNEYKSSNSDVVEVLLPEKKTRDLVCVRELSDFKADPDRVS